MKKRIGMALAVCGMLLFACIGATTSETMHATDEISENVIDIIAEDTAVTGDTDKVADENVAQIADKSAGEYCLFPASLTLLQAQAMARQTPVVAPGNARFFVQYS